jgi:hypothetical protein
MTKPKYTPEERRRVKAEILRRNVEKFRRTGKHRNPDRDLALKEGRKIYVGNPHKCGGVIRYVISGTCQYCCVSSARHKLYDGTMMKYESKTTPRRRQRIREQTPTLTPEQKLDIIEVYKLRDRLTQDTGITHEVDHIVPISKGGSHTPDNLQVITKDANRRKYNKY